MKYITFIILALLLSNCTLDDFLFNSKKLEKYILPGNNIPESLLEQVKLKINDGYIYGYWVKSKTNTSNTILYCHGNKFSIDEYWDRVMIMHEMDFNIFIYDYRSYGMSDGKSTQETMYSDAELALNFVTKTKSIPLDSLLVYGYSLGNVASIYLCANIAKPLGLIAEAPFASANSMTQGSISLDIPANWLTNSNYSNLEQIKKVTTPLLMFYGKEDDFVRFEDNGKLVFEAANSSKKLVLVEKAIHNNIIDVMGKEEYKNIILNWYKENIKK